VDSLIESLRTVVGSDSLLSEPDELLVYECDGLPQHKYRPRAVVFPSSTEETVEIMRVLARAEVPYTPRGAGTGLSGGALALEQGVVIEMARMRRILRIDPGNRIAVVQPGVVNLHVSRAAAAHNLHYVPDPSSQPTCTIGGNIAESAGGVHCLKYGTTTDHVLGIKVVLSSGEIVDLGGPGTQRPGFDLNGVFVGSEGTFGIATEATLRLVPIPPAVRTLLAEFSDVNNASQAVSAIIAAGLVPAGLEMMDREIIRAVEASVFAAGLPLDVGAALLVELDGLEAGIARDAEEVTRICLKHGARKCRQARDENERKKLWAARKGAFGAIGRISPDSMIQDAVVPRSRLPEVLAAAYQIAAKYDLRIANVFHAGDGNLHPLICFDSRFPDQVLRVKEAGRALMETCVRAGGTITGEHGVGLDKRELLALVFNNDDMDAMLSVRAAFDPSGRMNPGKVVPLLRGCGEASSLGSTGNGNSDKGVQPGQTLDKLTTVEKGQKRAALMTKQFNPDTARKQLASIVGKDHVSAHYPGKPQRATAVAVSSSLIVCPGTVSEVCEVMKLASNERWSVMPTGAGGWLKQHNAITDVNVLVDTTRLQRIVEHVPADLIAITQAGTTLKSFNEHLARSQQWLPVDPPDTGHATIGGVIATGLSGAQQTGYGPTRGFVIGMRVVLADGRLIKAGGRVVKNVAGYDLCKLFTGSYGTLGIIVEVNFKLRPRPQRESTVVAAGKPDSLIEAAHAIYRAPLFPVALELLSVPMARALEIESEDNDPILMARFAGNEPAVEFQTREALHRLQAKHAAVVLSGPEESIVWRRLAAIPLEHDNHISWSSSVPPSKLLKLIEISVTTGDQWQASVADGRMRVIRNPTESSATSAKTIREIRNECESCGGSLILESAPAKVRKEIDVWGRLGSAAGLMHRIKENLDPQGILSPRRFGF